MVIQQYQDPSVERRLAIGFWYQEHRTALLKVIASALIGANGIFWAYTLYGVGRLVLDAQNSARRNAELIEPLSDVVAVHRSLAPEPLAIDDVFVLPSASEPNAAAPGRVDFLARVRNENPDWIMDVSYAFRWEGGESERARWLLLPEEETTLAAIGAPVESLPGGVTLDADIAWERVRDPSVLIRPRDALAGISATDFDVTPRNGVTDISAVVGNASQYTVIAPSVLLVAERASGEPAAVWLQLFDSIEAQGTVLSQRRFLRPISGISAVRAYLNLDAFDEGTYRLRGGERTPF